MLNDNQVHQALDTALPAAIRPAVTRRLHRLPPIWSALHDEAFLKKAVSFAGSDPNRWRPGLLGLLLASETEYLRERFAQGAETLPVMSEMTRRKTDAAVHTVDGEQEPSLAQAALAALGLADPANASFDSGPKSELVWDCLYSIAPESRMVLEHLAGSLPSSAETLVQVLLSNEDTDRATEIFCEILSKREIGDAAALCDAAFRSGEDTLGRRLCGMAAHTREDEQPITSDSAAYTVRAKMLRLGGDAPAATTAADSARHGARRMLEESLRESALTAEADRNYTAALSFWQEAGALAPHGGGIRPGIARALSGLGRDDEALAMLTATDEPEGLLTASRILLKTGARDMALETARQAYARCAEDTDPRLAVQIAEAIANCGDLRNATHVLTAVSRRWPVHTPSFARLANVSAQANDWRTCNQAADTAWHLDPEDTGTLRLLAQSTLEEGRPAEAAEYFHALTTKLPDDPSTWISLAQAGLTAGDRTGAKNAADHALALNDHSGEAHAVLGQVALAEGDGDAAFTSLQKATRLSPAATAPWKVLAELHAARGNRDAAVTTLRAGAEAADNPADLLLMLGRLLRDSGMIREAASTLERAIGLRPGDAQILIALAESYLGLDRTGEAETCLNQALDLPCAPAAAAQLLSGLLQRAGRIQEARSALERALAAHPQSRDLLIDLGALLLKEYRASHHGNPAGLNAAVNALHQAAALSGDAYDPRLQSLSGWANVFTGELSEAVAQFGALVRGVENLPLESQVDAFCGLAEALLRSGDYPTAVSNLQSALQLAPGNETVRQRLGEALAASGLFEDAREVFRLILSDVPCDLNALSGLADALTALGCEGEAVATLRQAAEISPANFELWIRLAEAFFKAGEGEETRAALSHAIETAGPQNADIALRAGRLLLALNDFTAAETLLEQALVHNPSDVALLTEWGFAQRQAGRHGKAFDAFRRAGELEAANPEHLRNAAESLWDDGRKSAAIAFLKKAAQIDPHNVPLLRRLASGLVAVGFARDALPWYELALRNAPGDTALALEAARSALRAGDLDKADAWQESGADPKNPSAEGMIIQTRIALEKGNAAEAAALCQPLVTAHPEDGRGWALLAQALGMRRNVPDNSGRMESPIGAQSALRKALEQCDQSTEALSLTGAACLILEDYADAVRCLERLCTSAPEDPEAHTLLARASIQRAEALYREQLAGVGSRFPHAVSPAVADAVRGSLARAAALGADEDALQPLFLRAALVFSHPDPDSIASLEAVNDEHPSAETWLAVSQAWLRASDGMKARKAAEAAVNLAPEMPAARTGLGICEWKNGRRETALGLFAEAAAAAPHLALPHALAAVVLAELERGNEARTEMEQAVQAAPNTAAWQHTLGRWNEEAGNAAAGLPHLQRAAELEPQNGEYQLRLAHALAHDGDPHGALAHFRQAAALTPSPDCSLHAAIGKSALESGNCAEAYDAFQTALDQSGATAPFEWSLGKARAALALGRREEARALAKSVLAGKNHPPEARLILAEVDEADGRLQDAIRHLDHAATEMSDPIIPALRLARLWTATGSAARSEAALEALIEANPTNAEARHLLADALLALDRTEEALRASQKAVEIEPRKADHWILQGQIARKLGHLDQSLAALSRAHEIAPADWRTGLEVGLTYEAEQRWDLALDAYRSTLRLAPENAMLHYRLGVVHKNLRSYTEAVAALRIAIQIEPQNLAAHRLLSGVMALNLVYGPQDKPMDSR